MSSTLDRTVKECYSEAEAAEAVGISIARLHQLLDRYIFTGGNRRPATIEFTASDLLLLAYWNNHAARSSRGRVISMPRRH
ncbi:MAG TPA: hypothetical protein VKV05_03845 [Terriglobales bacterium]|nr:hypothetical protein [Terriglobales bacterium]